MAETSVSQLVSLEILEVFCNICDTAEAKIHQALRGYSLIM